MQTRRQYAISLGLAKDGRGRLSTAAKEAIQKALDSGVEFLDDNKYEKAAVERGKTDSPAKRRKQLEEVDPFPRPIIPDTTKLIGTMANGKKVTVSHREICRNCMYSLKWCHCGKPTALLPDLTTGRLERK